MWTNLEIQLERLRRWWCRLQHQSVRWPVRGQYECTTCYRRYAVPWAAPAVTTRSPFGDRDVTTSMAGRPYSEAVRQEWR
jgi:hypothetical protein